MVSKLKNNYIKELDLNSGHYFYYSLKEFSKKFPEVNSLPFSLKVLLENLLRFEGSSGVSQDSIHSLAKATSSKQKIWKLPLGLLGF